MPTYTIHAAPPKAGETTSDLQGFVFVRDGFHFWAFLLGPLWLLAYRLWLALIGTIAASALIGGALYLLGASAGWRLLAALLFMLLIGLEAATLRRWTLQRRGWRMLGFVIGDDEESAERRFFAEWTRAPAPSLPPVPAAEKQFATPVRRGPPSASDVIGLFPEPGGRP